MMGHHLCLDHVVELQPRSKEKSLELFNRYGHAFNLACNDAVKKCELMKSAMDIAYDLIKLVKKSPRRDATFLKVPLVFVYFVPLDGPSSTEYTC